MEDKEPTVKQWKRRALAAEKQVEFLQRVRGMESEKELRQYREIAALQVALNEINDAAQWAREQMT